MAGVLNFILRIGAVLLGVVVATARRSWLVSACHRRRHDLRPVFRPRRGAVVAIGGSLCGDDRQNPGFARWWLARISGRHQATRFMDTAARSERLWCRLVVDDRFRTANCLPRRPVGVPHSYKKGFGIWRPVLGL